jgi:transposase
VSRLQPGRARRLDAAHDELLPEQVATHPDATLAMRCERWNQAHPRVVSRSTVRRAIQRLGIALKRRV